MKKKKKHERKELMSEAYRFKRCIMILPEGMKHHYLRECLITHAGESIVDKVVTSSIASLSYPLSSIWLPP